MNYLGEVVFPVPTCTGSMDKEVLVSGRDRVLPPRDRVSPLQFKDAAAI